MGAKIFTVGEGYTPGVLLHYAHDHLASAEVLFERSFECFDSGGQLAHLGIELTLKAFLLEVTASFPSEHDLRKLVDGVKAAVPGFALEGQHERTIDEVNRFYLLRYPHPQQPISVGHLHLESIASLFQALVGLMPESMRKALADRDYTRKGGRVLMSKPKGSK